jgi:hypothetical protein
MFPVSLPYLKGEAKAFPPKAHSSRNFAKGKLLRKGSLRIALSCLLF